MKRPRAGIDLDGVVHQWSPTARGVLKLRFGIEIGESQTWTWIKDHTTPEQWDWLWSQGISWGLFLGEAYPFAIPSLHRLAETHDLVVITARPRDAIHQTLSWLVRYKIDATEVHILTNSTPKSEIRCDWYVDDNTDNVRELAQAGRRVYLFDQPWNRHETPAFSERVFGWPDLMHWVEGKPPAF